MKVYIIGKVTGLEYEHCRDLFAKREKELEDGGHQVVNPINVVPEGTPWIPAMKVCIKELIDCEGYSILPNALSSRGALLERLIAMHLKLIEIQ